MGLRTKECTGSEGPGFVLVVEADDEVVVGGRLGRDGGCDDERCDIL